MCGAWCLALLSFAVPQGGAADFHERVDDALRKAEPALEKALKQAQGDPLALVVLAAIHYGMTDGKPFVRALDRLERLETNGTYAISLRLMAAADFIDFPNRREVAARDLERLIDHQANGGGFGYAGKSWWDLSNTQYAALGLRAAASLGLKVRREVWSRLFTAVIDMQKSNGGFTYNWGDAESTATLSMTVAGIGVLEICRQHLQLGEADDRRATAAIERGWTWVERHRDLVGNVAIPNCLYAHYGLERAAILSGVERIGTTDWYRRGGEMILGLQRRSGEFQSKSDSHGKKIQTAFAVLFLRRSFRRVAGPVSPRIRCSELNAQSSPSRVREAAARDAEAGDVVVPALLRLLRSDQPARRRGAARALFLITGDDFRYHPGRTVEQNAAALARAEAWWAERLRRR